MFPAGGFEAGHIDQRWTQWLKMGGSCQGEIMEVVHERASRGFSVPVVLWEFLVFNKS